MAGDKSLINESNKVLMHITSFFFHYKYHSSNNFKRNIVISCICMLINKVIGWRFALLLTFSSANYVGFSFPFLIIYKWLQIQMSRIRPVCTQTRSTPRDISGHPQERVNSSLVTAAKYRLWGKIRLPTLLISEFLSELFRWPSW